jgi:hypothetical protein
MMKRMLVIFMFIILNTLAFSAGSDSNGSTNYQFLKMDVSARSLALGGAFCAVADDATGTRYNPAGLRLLVRPEVSFTHMEWIEDFRVENISYGKPLGISRAIGYNLFYISMAEDLIGRDEDGYPTGALKYEQSYFSFSWATRLDRYDNYLFGVNAKYAREILDYSENNALSFDLGLLLKLYRNVKFGMTVRNIGQSSESLPVETRAGISIEKPKSGLSIDTYKFKDSNLRCAIGYEYFIKEYFAIRTGYNSSLSDLGDLLDYENMSQVSDYSVAGLSLGFGILTKPLSFLGGRELNLDYAAVDYGKLGFTQIFTISMEI